MGLKRLIKIATQDVPEDDGKTAACIVVIEIYNREDRFDAVYKVNFPNQFRDTEDTFKIYNYIFN